MYQDGHNSIPPPRPVYDRPEMTFNCSVAPSYTNQLPDDADVNTHQDVPSLSRAIYAANPIIDPQTGGRSTYTVKDYNVSCYVRRPKYWSNMEATCLLSGQEPALALIARFILRAAPNRYV